MLSSNVILVMRNFSITGFGKQILNPIARSEIPSRGNISLSNIGEITNCIGIELELRKNLINNPEDDDI